MTPGEINSSTIKSGKIKKKSLQVDRVEKENYKTKRTQKKQDNSIGSTIFLEARKCVNFERPCKI